MCREGFALEKTERMRDNERVRVKMFLYSEECGGKWELALKSYVVGVVFQFVGFALRFRKPFAPCVLLCFFNYFWEMRFALLRK